MAEALDKSLDAFKDLKEEKGYKFCILTEHTICRL